MVYTFSDYIFTDNVSRLGGHYCSAYSGDAVIAVGGKLGTLSEIAFALIQDKPVIGINTWDLDKDRAHGNEIIVAENAKDAVKKAFELIK